MPRGEDHRLVDAAHGGRDAGRTQRGEARGEAGQEAERHGGLRQRQRLLAAAAEDIGVAALEPQHAAAGAGERDQQRVDRLLLDGGLAASFADEEQLGAFGHRDHLGIDQRVVHQCVGLAERRDDVEGQAAGVAWTGAGEPHMAGLEPRAARGDLGKRRFPAHARAAFSG